MNRIALSNALHFLGFSVIIAAWASACGSPSYTLPSQESTPGKGAASHGGLASAGATTSAGGSGGTTSVGTAGSPTGTAGGPADATGGLAGAAGTGTNVSPVGPTSCRGDAECSALRASRVCDTANELCVECLPGRTTCGTGLYCGADKECHVGCASNADCVSGNCDMTQHLCLGCQTNADCAVGTHCDITTAACVVSCGDTLSCPIGWTCCAGVCVNLNLDEANCGSCGTGCARPNANVQCSDAGCFILECRQGYENCNERTSDGCETDLLGQASSCGSCNNQCTSPLICKAGNCAAPDCSPGYLDCDKRLDNGCESNIGRDVLNCGSCSSPCSTANGIPSCDGGLCAITCNSGWGNCDGSANNGCESEFKTDINHCGRCQAPCTNDHGYPGCTDGKCTPSCSAGYGDCDGLPANGCETNVLTDVLHCGACGTPCSLPHATSSCASGQCGIVTCAAGWYDCNGQSEDGCEVNLLEDPNHCGTCSTVCSKVNGTASCSQGKCAIACATNYGNCDEATAPNNGCETDLTKNVSHCSKCGTVCTDKPNGTAICANSTCGVSCAAGFGNCNPDLADGCETDTLTNLSHCGGCNKPCAGKCSGGVCTLTPCSGRCSNPQSFTIPKGGNRSFNVGSGAFCFETTDTVLVNGNCSNFQSPRAPHINDTAITTCNSSNWNTMPPASNGGYCIWGDAGGYSGAAVVVWPASS